MEGRRIRMKAAAATTLALTGGYLLMEGDFKKEKKGRQIEVFLICCPFSFRALRAATVFSERYGHPGGHLFELLRSLAIWLTWLFSPQLPA
jgi:hypothetical protein